MRYTVTYYFGWHVEDTRTHTLSVRALSEEHAWRLALYLSERAA